MELSIKQEETKRHSDIVTGLSWSDAGELLTVSDDKTVRVWNTEGEPQSKLTDVPCYCTGLAWHPSSSSKSQADVFVVGCTDGSFKLISQTGRIEKNEPSAHQGAVTVVRWSHDGASLATAGEDGLIKSWSRTGMFRANLAQSEGMVHDMCWSPDADQMLFTCDKHLVVRPLAPSAKQTKWKAHEAPVLCVEWNRVNGLIVSGGEDCKYRLWDAYGRQLYCSAPVEYSISAVSWAPNGRVFAVGSFNMLRLCDKAGWSYSRAQPACGSIFKLAWTGDSTQVAAGSGTGAVLFGQIVHREVTSGVWEARQTGVDSVSVTNVMDGHREDLTFKDRVTEMSMSASHLIVVTATQVCIHSTTNFNTPHIVELRGTVSLIIQAGPHFAMVDSIGGLQVLGYDGRVLSHPKFPGMRPDALTSNSVAYAADLLAIVDPTDTKVVRLFEPLTGRPLGTVQHALEVEAVSLSAAPSAKRARRLALIDKNRDLHITPTEGTQEIVKLHTMVDTIRWSSDNGSLAAIADGSLVIWYYPEAIFVDRDVLPATISRQPCPDVGKSSELLDFAGTRATIRRSDGAVVTYAGSPYPAMVEKFAAAKEWESALRLCRYVKSPELPTSEAREAELLLFRRKRAEAVSVLVQGGWVYRAIKMCIRCFAWEQAYDIARTHSTHLDTVLYHRQRHLTATGAAETLPKLQKLAAELGQVDEAVVKQKVEAEKEREKARGGQQVGA